jgi:hypothetical protein
VPRDGVDDRFLNDITRDRHIVIHGSSKQGKSSLRKYHLQEGDYVTVQCTRDSDKLSIYAGLLKQAGARVIVTETSRDERGTRMGATGDVSGGIPFVGRAKVQFEGQTERRSTLERVTRELEIDLEDPNDVARVLGEMEFTRFVVVEDFHYLDEEVQRSLAFDLKVFHENSPLVFIIVGVWLETNRLILFNGDLTGRVSTINVDRWEPEDLDRVIAEGEPLLNIQFSQTVRDRMIEGCEGNVGLLQELCYRMCEQEGIWETLEDHREIDDEEYVSEQLTELAEAQAARYLNALADFPKGFGTTELEMYRWIAWVVISSSPAELRYGLRANEVYQRIADQHPGRERIYRNNVIQALDRVEGVQHRHQINPPILDFSDRQLRVVDAQFLVFLRTQERERLLEAIGDPAEEL